MANIRGLLGAIAELPGVINQGLLGPLPLNPQLEQMIGPAQAQAHRQQAQNEFAMSLVAGGRNPQTLLAASQGARQGFSGRIFDLMKEQEGARLMQAQQDELARQARFSQSPVEANLPQGLREQIVAKTVEAQNVPVSPNIQAQLEAGLAERKQQHEYDMALQRQRDANDLQVQAMKNAGEVGGMTPLQHTKAVQALRKEYRSLPSVRDYETVLPLIQSAKKAPDTGYGDLQLIYTVGKALDPNSVVREGELQLTLAAADPVSKTIGQAQFVLQKGGRLTPKLRKDLVEMLEQRTSSYRDAYQRDFKQYSQYAREQGIDAETIVGSRAESAYETGSTASFATEAEAEAAAARGELKPGTRVTIGGQTGTWR